MKSLLLLRHAKSSWDEQGLADHDRPLNKRGKRDAPRMGQLLRERDLTPDFVISSTAKRARRTAELVAEHAGYAGDLVQEHSVYGAGPSTMVAVLAEVPDEHDRIMLVGHNPGMEELVGALTGKDEAMPTAALALIRLPIDHWDQLDLETNGELVDLWRPKEI